MRALAPLNLMKHAQIGSVTAGPRKYFKKPVSFSVMDVNVGIRGKKICSPELLFKTTDSTEQRTTQPSLVKRLNHKKTNVFESFSFLFCF